jgi:phosphatidylserine/phosphatidylglycerophosphate/cardiolipin synthase-like enzyme
MITKGKAGDAVHAAFILQEGVTDAHARDFTADQLDQASQIGDQLAEFIDAAKFSLHMAIYDFRLDGAAAEKVIGALNAKAEAGITVRVAYFQPPKQPTPEASPCSEATLRSLMTGWRSERERSMRACR